MYQVIYIYNINYYLKVLKLTLDLEFGVPGVGIPPGIVLSNDVAPLFKIFGVCLKVVTEG